MSEITVPTPDRSTDSNQTADSTQSVFEERNTDMESYWSIVACERFLQKLCVAYDVGVTDEGYAQFNNANDASPIAADGLFYHRNKKEMKQELRDQREDGTLNDDQNLPNYRDEFDAPQFDHTVVNANNAEDWGMSSDQFEDGEKIFLPDDYEPDKDDDGNMIVWHSDTDGVTTKRVIQSLQQVKGIGDQKAGKALNQLQEDGILPDDI